MRHMKAGRTFNRDTNARKAMFIGLAKNLIEKEQIKTTLPKAKDLRSVVEKLITRAKVDTVANRRLTASELGNNSDKTVKKLFAVLGPRYAKRPGGYTRVLKAGFRYGDAAPMAIIELVDRDENAKKVAPKTVAHGLRCGRRAFLHQCACHRALSQKTSAGMHGFCHWRGGAFKRAV